jgi:hypothetical protein
MIIISARDPASVLVRKAGAALVSTQRGNAFSAEVTLNFCSVAGKGGHFANTEKVRCDTVPNNSETCGIQRVICRASCLGFSLLLVWLLNPACARCVMITARAADLTPACGIALYTLMQTSGRPVVGRQASMHIYNAHAFRC